MEQDYKNNQAAKPNGDAVKIAAEIKKTWPKLTDAEIGMYDKQPDAFFDALKTKHSVMKEDAVKKMKDLKTNCGCSNAAKAA